MSTAQTFRTIDEVKAANEAAGHNWFSKDTMRFFNSRVCGGLVGGRYFVTSEKYDYDSPRLYTVREVNADGTVDTVGEFQGYDTADKAKRAAWRMSCQDALTA